MEAVPEVVPAAIPAARTANPVDLELFFEVLREGAAQDRKANFLNAMQVMGAEALCTSEALSFLNRHFSISDIEEILRAGFLQVVRSKKILLGETPKIKVAADRIDQEVLSKIIVLITQNAANCIEVIEAALQAGLDVNQRDAKGCALLHYAAQKNNQRLAQYLLEHVADPCAVNKKGQIPSNLVEESNRNLLDFFYDAVEVSAAGKLEHVEKDHSCSLPRDLHGDFRLAHIRASFVTHTEKVKKMKEMVESTHALDQHIFMPQNHLSRSYIFPLKYLAVENRSLIRSRLINFLWTVENYFSEAEIRDILELHKDQSIDKKIHPSLLTDNIDLIGDFPKIMNCCYGRATNDVKAENMSSCDHHVIFAFRLARNQIEKNSDTKHLFRTAHEKMRALVISYVYKELPKDEKKRVSHQLFTLINLFSREEAQELLRVCPALVRLREDSFCETLLFDACRRDNIELAELLVKHGADVFAKRAYMSGTPTQQIKPASLERWRNFLDKTVGQVTASEELEGLLLKLKYLKITTKFFFLLPLSLQARIRAMDFSMVKNDPIGLEITMPAHMQREQKQFNLPEFMEIKKEVDFRRLAFEVALYRKNKSTPFWGNMPRDVALEMVVLARPDGMSRDIAMGIANGVMPQPTSAAWKLLARKRYECIERLTDYLDRREGNLLAHFFLCEALQNPTDENKKKVEEFLDYYVTVKDERFQALYRSCLTVLEIGVKPRDVISPPVDALTLR